MRQGTPLVLGIGEGEQFLASDPAALLAYTRTWSSSRTATWRGCTRDGIDDLGSRRAGGSSARYSA